MVEVTRRCKNVRRRAHRVWRLVPLSVLVLLGSACQAEFAVDVTVDEDGSGLVETTTVLDAEASDHLVDLDLDDGTGLELGDLAQSGWVVGRPTRRDDGSTEIVASKAFGTPEQFSEVMAEIGGEDGPFRDFTLVRQQRFAQVDYIVQGEIDTSAGFGAFSDDDLETALGRSLDDIVARYGGDVSNVNVAIELSLPGEASGAPPAGVIETSDDELRARWTSGLGNDDVTPVVLSSATRQVAALVLRGIAVVAGVLAAIVVFAQVLRILRPDRRRKNPPRRTSDIRSRRPTAPVAGPVDDRANPVPQRVLALDGMGVLYREANDVGNVLIPFARERGSSAPDEEIEARVRALRLGRLNTAEFWASIGVPGHPDALDAAYLNRHQLTPGIIKYLRAQRDRGLRVACITNDSPTWAYKLRAGHSLENLIDPWVISGSVGVGKPDRPIFEVLRRVTGEPPSAILVIDDDLDILDAARNLGFATMWYAPQGNRERARGHRLIRAFDAAGHLEEPFPAGVDVGGEQR